MTKPSIPGYTDADLASLTPDELSALESDSGDNEAELTEIAGEAEATGAAAGEATAAAGEGDVGEAAGETATEETSTSTVYVAEAPEDAAAQIEAQKAAKAAAKAEDKEAFKKLMDGEIDADAYAAIQSKAEEAIEAANEQISTIKQSIAKAEMSAEMQAQEAARSWAAEVNALTTAAKAEGFDYKAKPDLAKEFDGLVRVFGQEATMQGMSDEGLKASKWALAQAHATMKMRHADLVVKPKTTTTTTTTTTGQRHGLTTLANMPNADRALGDNDDVAKFAQLEGEDLERALAGMSKEQVAKLMASV